MSDESTADPAAHDTGATSESEVASPDLGPGQQEEPAEPGAVSGADEAEAFDLREALTASLEANTTDTAEESGEQAGEPDGRQTPEGEAAGGEQKPAEPEQQTANRFDNLTPEEAIQQLRQYDEELHDIKSRYGRQRSEIGQLQEQLQSYGGVQPQQLEALVQAQQRQAELQRLKPWNQGHPEHGGFAKLLQKVHRDEQLMARATPETQEALQSTLQADYSAEERQLLQEYYQHRSDVQQEFAADPDGYIQSRVQAVVDQMVPQYFSQYENWNHAKAENHRFFNDPDNKPLIDKYQSDMVQVMESGGNHNLALEHARLKAEVDKLREQLGQSAEKVATADAQQQSLNKRSTVRRDSPVQATAEDPVEAGRKQGLKGPDLVRYLQDRQAG